MYNEQKANGALIRDNQNANNKSVEKHKNIIGLKFRLTVIEKRKLREVVRKRGKVPPILIFPPLRFKILRLLTSLMDFCFKVSGMWVERG